MNAVAELPVTVRSGSSAVPSPTGQAVPCEARPADYRQACGLAWKFTCGDAPMFVRLLWWAMRSRAR